MSTRYPRSLVEAIKVIKQWEIAHCEANNRCVELQREVADATNAHIVLQEENRKILRRGETAIEEANRREKETRLQFDDLKQRVHALEIENAQMLGYLNRVQEDDEVREELIAAGDPAGEQTLTPKRKQRLARMYTSAPTALHGGDQYREPWRERPKSKHWVNY